MNESTIEVTPEVTIDVTPDVVETTVADVISIGNWAITVSDKDGAIVKKFDNVTEAMEFANLNGYSLHAE